MNHWFLCGRDLMWFLVGTAPIIWGQWAGLDMKEKSGRAPEYFLIALFWQWMLITLLYEGTIR
jgi:hypothetical protein